MSEGELVEDHPPDLKGQDVCVLPAAFPAAAAPSEGKVGWRGLVTAKRGSKSKETVQVKVYGAWFDPYDDERIQSIRQLEAAETRPMMKQTRAQPANAKRPAKRVIVDSSDEEGAHKEGWKGVVKQLKRE